MNKEKKIPKKDSKFTDLIENCAKKTKTFNGGELYWLFKPEKDMETDWSRRITCAVCFTKKFFKERGIEIEAPYKIFLCSSFIEVKSLLYEKSAGKFILQPNAASAVVDGVLFAEQRARGIMDIHEYIHIIMDNLQETQDSVKNEKIGSYLPMWCREGLPQYIQGKKDGINYFELARSLEYIPPFVLESMNYPTEKFWLEFGLMEEYMVSGNHPGLTACASFVQFLIEKEKIGFRKFWELARFKGRLSDFYKKIEDMTGNSLYNILNNYLYYIDKPFIAKNQITWEMPVTVARDFREKFVSESKKFDILKNLW